MSFSIVSDVKFAVVQLRSRVRTCFGKFWKVTEIDNAIFKKMENFGKEKFSKSAMERFFIFVWENSKIC